MTHRRRMTSRKVYDYGESMSDDRNIKVIILHLR